MNNLLNDIRKTYTVSSFTEKTEKMQTENINKTQLSITISTWKKVLYYSKWMVYYSTIVGTVYREMEQCTKSGTIVGTLY